MHIDVKEASEKSAPLAHRVYHASHTNKHIADYHQANSKLRALSDILQKLILQ